MHGQAQSPLKRKGLSHPATHHSVQARPWMLWPLSGLKAIICDASMQTIAVQSHPGAAPSQMHEQGGNALRQHTRGTQMHVPMQHAAPVPKKWRTGAGTAALPQGHTDQQAP